jgi:hypothetical protein
MPKYAYNHHYRMTAARRAALKKAQLASAKKRRKRQRVAKSAAGVVAVTAIAAGGIGGYKRGKNKRVVPNVVSVSTATRPNAVHPLKKSNVGKEIDLQRHGINDQLIDEDSTIDYGIVGMAKRRATVKKARRTRGKANVHVKSKRIISVHSNGVALPGAKARGIEKARMTYSPKKRSVRYRNDRDRPTPPAWLDPYGKKLKARNDRIRAKTFAAKKRKK